MVFLKQILQWICCPTKY